MTADDWTVVATSERLLSGQLHDLMAVLAAAGDHLPADAVLALARLITAVSSLRDEHAIDAHGRCRLCRSKRQRRPHRAKPCSVHSALDLSLESSLRSIGELRNRVR